MKRKIHHISNVFNTSVTIYNISIPIDRNIEETWKKVWPIGIDSDLKTVNIVITIQKDNGNYNVDNISIKKKTENHELKSKVGT